MRLDPRLRERGFGAWEGMTMNEIESSFPEEQARWRAGNAAGVGEESFEAFATRVGSFIEEVSRRHDGEAILVVAHGGTIRVAHAAGGGPRLRPRPPVDPGRGQLLPVPICRSGRKTRADRLTPVEDYTNKYKGEQVEIALFGGEYQEGVLTAYCYIEDVAHIELNGHILVPLQNIASLHCSSRCDAPEPDWPPRGLEDEREDT